MSLPEFMNPTEGGVLTEKNVSGEAVEMLRFLVNANYPDLQDGESGRISYKGYDKMFDARIGDRDPMNVPGDEFYSHMREKSSALNSLGQFMVHKEDGQLIIVDKYDFERGANQSIHGLSTFDAIKAGLGGDVQAVAQEIGEFLMPEEREDNMRVRIVIPPEPEIQEMLFDEEPEPEATEFVFRGQMTPKRYELWKHFSGTV